MITYKPRWKAGTFPTGTLKPRIDELLALIEDRARGDRAAGRLVIADQQDELVEAVQEYVRLLENALRAARQTIDLLGTALRQEQIG